MKVFSFLTLAAPLLLLCCCDQRAIAQGHDHNANAPAATAAKPAPTEAQRSFAELKTLAGVWRGNVTLEPTMEGVEKANLEVTMRVTSRGHTIVHELQEADTPLDATKYDHPVTMLYLDEDKLTLVHYCDAGNRPRMTGKASPDGKTVDFSFLDVSGPTTKYGNMHDAKFTIVDENHHIEDWWYLLPGNKMMHAHMDLYRKPATVASAK